MLIVLRKNELCKTSTSLRSADAFPVVASQRSDDRKCVCAAQARHQHETERTQNIVGLLRILRYAAHSFAVLCG